MNNLGAFIIIGIGILTVVPIFATGEDLLFQRPILKLLEVDGNNNVIRLYNQIDIERSEIIVERFSHLRLECEAYYPVQWTYTGDGTPTMHISLSTIEIGGEGLKQYTASSFISSINENDTGKYQCKSTRVYNTGSSNIYIYVPGENLFTSLERKTIPIRRNVPYIFIPCSVSHPNVKVSLHKWDEDTKMWIDPLTTSNNVIEYNPRKGYRVNLKQTEDPEGMYLCVADYNNLVKQVDYTVNSESPSEPVLGNLEEFQGDEGTCTGESCKECTTHTDCPAMMRCNTAYKCQDPCVASISCGKGSKCRTIGKEKLPECYCPRGFVGDPTEECYARYTREP